MPVTVRASAPNARLFNDRREPHAVQREMFVPTSQFHPYGHVTSSDPSGDAQDGRGSNDNNDNNNANDEEEEVDDENNTVQLTVACKAARDVRFYLTNIFLILVLITCHSCK